MRFYILLLAIMAGIFGSCSTNNSQNANTVFVSILPQRFVVSKIAGDTFEVKVMVQPGHSPKTYEPLPRQMGELSRAKAFFLAGVQFEEAWLEKIRDANPSMTIVDTTEGITLRHLDTFSDEHHSHEDALSDNKSDSHSHEGMDPHTWLSPSAMKIQARNITKALIRLSPENKSLYENNLLLLESELDVCIDEIHQSLENLNQRQFMVFHPAFGYFADEFRLKQIPVEIEGKEPSPSRLKQMIDHARKNNIRVIFVQKQFSTKSAEAVAAGIDGSVIQIDPLEENYIDNLHAIAAELERQLR